MCLLRRCGSIVALVALIVSASDGWGADSSKEFRAAKLAFQHKMKKKAPLERVAAFAELAGFPTPEAAGLIVKLGLGDPAEEVRRAASDALRSQHEHPELGKRLLEQLNLTTRRTKMDEAACLVLRALGAYDFPEVQDGIVKYLNDFLETPKGSLLQLTVLIDDLGIQGDADALQVISTLSRAKLFEKHFGYRRCIVQAVNQIRVPGAITFLIDMLPEAKGLVQFDIVQHLRAVSNEDFKDDHVGWSKWWQQNQGTFKFPPKGSAAKPDGKLAKETPAYYGIPICAKRVVFVLDTSGSMRGGKLDAAKRELVATIKQLPEEVFFSMVFFSNDTKIWHASMVPATEEFKTQATQTVNAQGTGRDTASFDALEAAFSLDPEEIFFLSDGAPTSGKIVDPTEILMAVTHGNRTRRVSIDAIGIGTTAPRAGRFNNFMGTLAGSNWGTYIAVDH
jgi:hypothetical protein